MPTLNSKGFAHLFLLLILAVGLIAGVYLVTSGDTLKLFPKAAPVLPTAAETSFELELEQSGVISNDNAMFPDEATPTSLVPDTKFRVDVYARSDVEAANLFNVKVKYTADTVEFVGVEKRDGQSFIKNWVETSGIGSGIIYGDPLDKSKSPVIIDNASSGLISMIGGVPGGIKTDSKSGALLMGSIIFKTKKAGLAKIGLSDGNSAIYSNANNINILTAIKGTIEVPILGTKPSPCGTYGDVNLDGVISKDDADLILKFIVGTAMLTTEQKKRADVNADTLVDVGDVTHILRYLTGLISTFNICASPSPTPVVSLWCSGILAEGGIQSKLPNGESVYILESDGKMKLTAQVNLTGVTAAWTVQDRPTGYPSLANNGGFFDYPAPGLIVNYTAPKNVKTINDDMMISATVTGNQQRGSTVCSVLISVKPAAKPTPTPTVQPTPSPSPAVIGDVDSQTKEMYDLKVTAQVTTEVRTSGGPLYVASTILNVDGDRLIKNNVTELSGYLQRSQAPYGDDQVAFTYQKDKSPKFVSNLVKLVDNNCIDLYKSKTKQADKYFATFCFKNTYVQPKSKNVYIYSYNANPFMVVGEYIGGKTATVQFLTTAFDKNVATVDPLRGGSPMVKVVYLAVESSLPHLFDFKNVKWSYQPISGGLSNQEVDNWCNSTVKKYLRQTELPRPEGGNLYVLQYQNYCTFNLIENGLRTSFLSMYKDPTNIPVPSPTPTPTSSPTPQPGNGDGNKDGKVDFIDLSILLTDYNKNQGIRAGIDINGDGAINAFDFSLMRNILIKNGLIKG